MIVTLLLCFLLIVVMYFWSIRKYNYWASRGVKYEEGVLFFGSIGNVYAKKMCFSEYIKELYEKYPHEKLVGFFISHGSNALIVRDPELIKHVLVSDFQYFHPRALNGNQTVTEPMLKNVFFADGNLWKLLRKKLATAFTIDKIKAMYSLILDRTVCLQRTVIGFAERGVEVNVERLMAGFTTDVISVCGFGIDSDCLKDPSSEMIRLSKRMIASTERDALVAFLKWTSPETNKSMYNLPPEVEGDVVGLVKSVMQKRNYKSSGRADFIDFLLELKAEGVMVGKSINKRNSDGTPQTIKLELDEVLIAAQAFMFFVAGFETTTSATSFTLHQLALHPDKQAKCHQEIDEVLLRYQGILSYESIKELKYLHMCLKESMRMLPPMGFLIRQCVETYTIPETNVTIEAGVNVIVSVHGLHNDKQYFENPDQFRPERFGEGCHIPNNVYLPFGHGPRACIAQQLGEIQSLAGLVAVLVNCSVACGPSTRPPLVASSSFISQNFEGGLPLLLIPRKNYIENSQFSGVTKSGQQQKVGNKKQSSGNRISRILFRKKISLEKIPTK